MIEIQKTLKDNMNQLIDNNKVIILDFLKEELSSRYEGLNGRIKASLATDKQFQTGLKLLQDKKYYNKLLQKGS